MGKKDAHLKEIKQVLKKIAPELKQLQEIVEQCEDSVIGENVHVGVNNLLIAQRILKDRKK